MNNPSAKGTKGVPGKISGASEPCVRHATDLEFIRQYVNVIENWMTSLREDISGQSTRPGTSP